MLKYNVGDRLIVKGNITSNHGFKTGEVRIVSKCLDGTKDEHYLAENENTGTVWYIDESELKEEGANTMNMKHDGYVVVDLEAESVGFNFTKDEALAEVEYLLRNDTDPENILVFPPNSNLPFSYGVKLID
jgi:hypothetical protein